VEEVTETLFPLAEEVILTAPAQPRALHPRSISEMLDDAQRERVHVAESIREALQVAAERNRTRPMTTFVTGSLFLVGEARELLAANQ